MSKTPTEGMPQVGDEPVGKTRPSQNEYPWIAPNARRLIYEVLLRFRMAQRSRERTKLPNSIISSRIIEKRGDRVV